MLRLTEIKLPLDHPDDALRKAICQHLGVAADELLSHSVYRRSVDARKKTAITLIYACLLYTSPSPRDRTRYRMPSSA